VHRAALALLVVWGALGTVGAQLPLNWDVVLGGEDYEELTALEVLPDGILVGGSSKSNVALGNPNDFSWNMLVAKLDFDGSVLWQRDYGGNQSERLWAMIPTRDGGFLAGGYSFSGIGGDKSEANRGDKDVWILKIDAQGQPQWDKTFGGLFQDELFGVLEMPDGGYLLGCHSNSDASGDKTQNSLGFHDIWLIRTDAFGNKLWDRTIGGSGYEQINDLVWAPNGNVYCSGGTTSPANSGDLGPVAERGGMDFLLMQVNPLSGAVLWSKRYGGTGEDYAYSLVAASNGLLYMGGRSGSSPSPPTSDNNGKSAPLLGGPGDYWLVELEPDGTMRRDWSYGGSGLDDLYFIREKPCGGFILGGVSNSDSSGNKTSALRGAFDFWILSITADASLEWQQSIGGAGNDALTQIAQAPDGSLYIGGHSDSGAGFEKSADALGLNDFWVVSSRCSLNVEIQQLGNPSPCSGEPLTLDASVPDCPQCVYQWSEGSSTPSIEIAPGTSGTYAVTICNEGGCVGSDSATIVVPPALVVNIGPADTLIEQGSALLLSVGNAPGLSYAWSNGSTAASIAVQTPGLYAVTVTDANGCSATDAIRVSIALRRQVWVPNAFTPDGDGFNDYIAIFTDESVLRVLTFQIADRWGGLCYRRDNFAPNFATDGWDGRWRGQPAPSGVYTWFAMLEYQDGGKTFLEGSISLLR
jgi:gliding motility-associated-like protein